MDKIKGTSAITQPDSGRHATDSPDTVMLELVRQLAAELRRQSGVVSVNLDSLLERRSRYNANARRAAPVVIATLASTTSIEGIKPLFPENHRPWSGFSNP